MDLADYSHSDSFTTTITIETRVEKRRTDVRPASSLTPQSATPRPFQDYAKESYQHGHPMSPLKHSHLKIRLTLKSNFRLMLITVAWWSRLI